MSRLVGSIAIRSCLKLVATCAVCVSTSADWPTTLTVSLIVAGPIVDVQRQRLRRREGDRLLLPLEAAQLERHGVGARRQLRQDVVAVLRGHDGEDPLKVGPFER